VVVVGLDVGVVAVVVLGFVGVEGAVVAEICCCFAVEDKNVHFGIDAGCIDGDGRCGR
jgi:RNase P/RNase MRP subunit p29